MSIDHLEAMPRDRLVADLAFPDRKWSYGPDYAGRWLEALSVAARLPIWRDRNAGIREVLTELCRFQRPDGMLGREDSTGWAVAGCGLKGLVEAYATFSYPEALQAARKLVDYFDKHFPRRPSQRACLGLRDLVRYTEVSGDERGLAVARRMYDDCPELGPRCPFEKISGNVHIYTYIHRGLVDLYRHTADRELLDQAIAWRNWLETNLVWVSGGVNEWLSPTRRSVPASAGNADPLFFDAAAGVPRVDIAQIRDETCTTGDWLMLNLELALAAGEDRYTEMAEHTLWNHFLAGQAANGGWCGHRDLTGLAGEVWDFCCSMHGPRCLLGAMRHALVQTGDGLRVNLHMPVAATFSWPDAKAEATLEFDPSQPSYAVAFGEGTGGQFAVRFRRPAWANDLRIQAHGKPVSDTPYGDIVVGGRWQAGDRIACRYSPAVVVRGERTLAATSLAVQRGPLMLAATDFTSTSNEIPPVRVRCEKTGQARRVVVELGGRFEILKGLFWVSPHLIDWRDPARGITFTLSADGAILADSRKAPAQGYMPSRVIATRVRNNRQLVIEMTSTHSSFPIEGGNFTSLQLFSSRGDIATLDAFLEGGAAPVQRLRVSRAELNRALAADIRQWPRRLKTEAGGHVWLLPMKDLPKLLRPEGGIGQCAPIAHTSFSVLLPMEG